MASHRKWSPTGTRIAGIRTPALATAALTSVALLSQTANAAPSADSKPSIEEVEKKVDDLYHQAEAATEKYNATREKTAQQRKRVDSLLDDVAQRTEKRTPRAMSWVRSPRRSTAPVPPPPTPRPSCWPTIRRTTSTIPKLMDRLTSRQKVAVDDYITEQAATTKKRAEASQSLQTLTTTQSALRTSKADVQRKLAEARDLLRS